MREEESHQAPQRKRDLSGVLFYLHPPERVYVFPQAAAPVGEAKSLLRLQPIFASPTGMDFSGEGWGGASKLRVMSMPR